MAMKNEANKNTQAGFVPIRRGIYEHLNDGRMTGKEWMVYTALHLKADHLTGICYKISGPMLAGLLQINPRMANRLLTNLEEKGYIRRLNHRGQVLFYPVVINKFLTSNGLLIDAHNTKSLNEIAFYTEYECLLSVFQMSFKCLSNVLYTRSLKEVKNITILKQQRTPKGNSKVFSEDSVEYKLAKLLFDTIHQRKPDFKEKDLQKWAIHIDRMIRIDHREPEQIRSVILWSQQDHFWQNNILSTEKLQRQFDQLELKMRVNQNGSSKVSGSNQPTEQYIR